MHATATLLLLAALACPAADLSELYANRQWFAFRDAVQSIKRPRPVVRGIVGCVFNDAKACQEEMTRVLDSRSPAPEKLVAHLRLAYWYFLAGRNRAAQPHYDAAMRLARTPQGDGTGAFIHHFSHFADQSVAALEPSTLRYETKNGTIWLPLTINGVATAGLLDTCAGLSAVNESTALRFGLPVFDIPPTEATDFGNKGAAIAKIAFAHQLDLGKIRLTNVPFLVLSDKTWPVGPVLGLQILLACRRISWNSDGGLRLAHPSPARSADSGPNLVLDNTGLLAAASFAGRPLDFELDTASPLSHLYQRFADAFPALVKERGTSKPWSIGGISGKMVDTQATVLPELTLNVLAWKGTIRPAPILPNFPGDVHHGLLGLDVLSGARQVTLDFEAMRLTVE